MPTDIFGKVSRTVDEGGRDGGVKLYLGGGEKSSSCLLEVAMIYLS